MKNSLQTHPTREQLTAFGLGQLSADVRMRIEQHVAECDSCCQQLRLVPDDTLLDRLKSYESTNATSAFPAFDTPVRKAATTGIPPELMNHSRYKIVKVLGNGGMGVVYEAEHRMMERSVAVKVIRSDVLNKPTAVDRFRLEVKAAARLAHPNIVAALDAEQAGDLHFLVMEYVDGISLDRLVQKRGPLTVLQACNYVRQAALGLQHAFERGMVHRDIKPQNLMLNRKWQVKILDFGLARFAREQEPSLSNPGEDPLQSVASTLTQTCAFLGTPDYIAPEQAIDARHADIRADIYSLGCTLYFMLAGRTPFPKGSILQKLAWHRDGKPQPLTEIRTDLPPGLLAVIDRMIAKDPGQRYQTPAEVAQALAPFAKPNSPQSAKQPDQPPPVDGLAELMREWLAEESNAGKTANLMPPITTTMPRNTRGSGTRWLKAHRTQLIGFAVLALFVGCAALGVKQAIPWLKTLTANDSTENAKPNDSIAADSKPSESTPVDLNPESVPAASGNQAAGKRVVIVLAANGFYYPDYAPVRQVLEAAGAKVIVASPEWTAHAMPGDGSAGPTVNADLLFEQVKPSDYDAVVFCGGDGVQEFVGSAPQAEFSRRLIRKMLDSKKLVTGLCKGPVILAEAGILKGLPATCWPQSADLLRQQSVDWVDDPVVVSGNIITGRAPQDAQAFANVLVKRLSTKY